MALSVGTALGWITSMNEVSTVRQALLLVKVYPPVFPIKSILTHFNTISLYLSTTIPTAISIAICTIQCVESAKRAGDFYPTRESMFADGIGTLISSFFGSILGMTSRMIRLRLLLINYYYNLISAYIGHPAFKKMGARQGYSIIHGFSYLPLCFFGINALLVSIIAIVSINPIVVRI